MAGESPPVTGAAERPADGALAPGEHLGKYEIIRRLAVGGMGDIYVARASGPIGFEKIVVIKRVLPHLASDTTFVSMFLDEARLAATLQHPNLAQVYDAGVDRGSHYMVMEYLHGEDVRAILKRLTQLRRRIPMEHAINIVLGVCAGVHYAHELAGPDGESLGIVHRDVSPRNVIVTYEGGVKLLDFGVAKARGGQRDETRAGTLKGKAGYMSPEQCAGVRLDRRSDVFALGTLMYEMLAGRRLFRGVNDFQTMKQVVEGGIAPLSSVNPECPPQLDKVVMRALSRSRAARFPTAAEMQAELEVLVRSQRIYLSPSQLKQFLDELFGRKVEAWKEDTGHRHRLDQRFADVSDDDVAELSDGDLLEVETESSSVVSAPAGATAGGAKGPAPDEPEPITEASSLASFIERAQRGALKASTLDTPVPSPETPVPSPEKPLAAVPPALPQAAPPSPEARVSSPAGRRWLVVAGAVCAVAAAGVAWSLRPTPAAVEKPAPEPTLIAPMAIVKVVTTPPGATLFLDGKKLAAATPTTLDSIAAGPEHVLLVQHAGWKDALTRFQLTASEVKTLEVKLEREPAPAAPAAPPPTAKTPAPAPEKPAVAARARPTRAAASDPTPTPPPAAPHPATAGRGALLLDTRPWCNVTIDGADKGATPLNVVLPAGPHTVVLSNPEFQIHRTIQVEIVAGETLKKKLQLGEP